MRLAGGDGHPLEQRESVVRQLHQKLRLRGEGLAEPEAILFWAGSIRRQDSAPDISLSIQVNQIGKFPDPEKPMLMYRVARSTRPFSFPPAAHRREIRAGDALASRSQSLSDQSIYSVRQHLGIDDVVVVAGAQQLEGEIPSLLSSPRRELSSTSWAIRLGGCTQQSRVQILARSEFRE
jgi:hypothetical protein